jgi:hypothetical protein
MDRKWGSLDTRPSDCGAPLTRELLDRLREGIDPPKRKVTWIVSPRWYAWLKANGADMSQYLENVPIQMEDDDE